MGIACGMEYDVWARDGAVEVGRRRVVAVSWVEAWRMEWCGGVWCMGGAVGVWMRWCRAGGSGIERLV